MEDALWLIILGVIYGFIAIVIGTILSRLFGGHYDKMGRMTHGIGGEDTAVLFGWICGILWPLSPVFLIYLGVSLGIDWIIDKLLSEN